MESNITHQQTLSADLPLPEPHFEDEATLLSARPVVPLQRLNSEARTGRLLTFGLAIVVAIMIGALGATFVYKHRVQKQEAPLAETTASISQPTSAENSSGSEAGGAIIETDNAKPSTAETGVTTQKTPSADASKRSSALTSQSVASVKRANRQDQVLSKKDRKELRRAERADARPGRDLRHEARRETRQRRSSEGLLRIREIFEGPSRP